MSGKLKRSQASGYLPDPAPGLAQVHRVREAGSDVLDYIALDRNERVSPFPEWFMDEVRENLTSAVLSRYPVQDQLHRQLAQQLQVPEECLILTPSSDSAFKSLFEAYVQPGDGVVMLEPSYAMFPVYTRMFLGKAVEISYGPDMELDTERLLDSATVGVKLLLIANPNQPTGTLLDETVLRQLIERAAEVGALVVVDEAYHPFSHATALPWLATYPNLVVVRTFSKSAGLAGLRLGFAAGHPEVCANLFKVRAANDLNSMAIMCASLILKHPQVVDDYVAEVQEGGRLLADRSRALGLVPLPTHTNFMLIRVAHRCPPDSLVEALKQRGFLIKGPVDAPSVAGCVRVTLGPPDLMSNFADRLDEALSQVSFQPG